MNYQEPFNISNIDLNKIVYPKARTSQNKKIILLKYNDNGKLKNFVFQTPTLLNLFKASKINTYSEIEIALSGKEELKIFKFLNFLNNLEKKIKDDAQANFSSWFDINKDVQTINFQKIIRESDDNPNGTIKLKIINNTDFQTCLQINNNKNIKINDIPENSWCKLILECYAIWINSNNDFGLFLRPVLVSFTLKETYNYNFVEESDEDEFHIPDTEINTNIFMKINNTPKSQYGNSTTQLEINELVNKLDKNQIETCEFNNFSNSNNDIINLKINDTFFNDESSSIKNNDNENTYLDAETSE
jgi:hypothetical protein